MIKLITCPEKREHRKTREYYFSLVRTVAPIVQIVLTLYLIWRVQ